MPSLVLYSRLSDDSRRLRQAAQSLSWETLRLEENSLPDWFDPPDSDVALFMTAPDAFRAAEQLGRKLVGCGADWLPGLGERWLRRRVRAMSVAEALELREPRFIKHALCKSFVAQVCDPGELPALVGDKLAAGAILHVQEPVEWEVEYRSFVRHGQVVAMSPYRRGLRIWSPDDDLAPTASEFDAARQFAEDFLRDPTVAYPPAFVLDIGVIAHRGWAVVEANECWASGLYGCEPERALSSLLAACVPAEEMGAAARWDFARLHEQAHPRLP